MASTFQRSIAVAAGCACVAALGCNSFELPDPPDASGLVQAYEQPSGRLDRGSVRSISLALADRVVLMREQVPLDLVDELVDDVGEVGEDNAEFEESGGVQTIQGDRVDVAAVTRIHQVCRGWEMQGVVDEARNGSVELTMTVDRNGLIPTLWGHFDRCRLRRGVFQTELDGDLTVHFGTVERRIGLRAVRQVPYFFSFEGTLVVTRGERRVERDTRFSFRVMPSGEVQLSVGLPDGTNVVGEFSPGLMQPANRELSMRAGVLTRDQHWQCELERARGSCANQANAGEVVQW